MEILDVLTWKMVSGSVTVKMCTQKQRKTTPKIGTAVEIKRFLLTRRFT